MSIVWIFLDGVGLGADDPTVNPWASLHENTFIAVEGRPANWIGAFSKPLDAALGIDGLPQSATGTTALLTGINAPAALGKHLSGFPNSALQAIIAEHSIFKKLSQNGLRATFANAYNSAYFDRPAHRQSVTTHAVKAADLHFRMLDEYRAGTAVFHDISGELINLNGTFKRFLDRIKGTKNAKRYVRDHDTFAKVVKELGLQPTDPAEAGKRIANLAREYDFVLFEYVKTDMAGHSQDLEWASSIADEVTRFLRSIAANLNPETDTVLVASDHGNSENLSLKTHTNAPVAAVAAGVHAAQILENANTIADLAPTVYQLLAK